jgi:uncharacterized membrane protein
LKKIGWKKYLLTKLKIASFIFALVGWFLLFIFVFGQYFEKQLLEIEKFVQSNTFVWGLRIFIVALVVFLLKSEKLIERLVQDNKVRLILYIIFIGGALGWIWWFITLFYQG